MRILEIEKYFQTEETLDKVLEELADDFKVVDTWANNLKGRVADNPEEIRNALQDLSGAYSNLRTVLALAEGEKRNREVKRYNEIKIETENQGNKFVSASAEKQASADVAPYRRVRNIVLGYTESAEKMIGVLQNVNNNLVREHKTME